MKIEGEMLMKKSIIALAVAGALVAPLAQADATLYGSLRLKLQDLDGAETNIADNSSRIGIKGSSELFSGNKAIFQFEQAVSTETGAFSGGRLASLGVTGDFGTVNAGRQWSPFATWTLFPTDIVDNRTSGASGYEPGLHRLSNTIAYVSPNLSGFQGAVVLIADNDVQDGEDLDAYNLAAKYSVAGFTVAASTINLEAANQDVNSLAVSYEADAFYVAARYQEDETAGAGQEDSYEVAGSFTMGNTKLLANFVDSDDNDVGEQWSLEVQQKLGKKARVFAAWTDTDSVTDGEVDGIELGYRVDF